MNILWIITDQQSASMMGCVGNPYVKTPHMDFIAGHGVRFENAYCANPVCQPSRFALMTGLYPSYGGMLGDGKMAGDAPILSFIMEEAIGRRLTERGYTALYGGKQGIPGLDAAKLGFDYFCDDERDYLAEACATFIRDSGKKNPFAMVASFINPHDICLMAINDFAAQGSNEADRWIAQNMGVETDSVQKAMRKPEGMHNRVFFDTVCPPLPANHQVAADEPEAVSMLLAEREFRKLARERYSDESWRLHRWAYAKLTETVDKQIGIVLNALLDTGLWDETVIIFTSDHGDMDAAHKMEHKSALYQESCCVPLIIKGTGTGSKGRTDGSLVCNGLDCICTVMDYAGLPQPDYLPGISLRNNVEMGQNPKQREYLVVESELGYMAVGGHYKYTRYFQGANSEQFYDLTNNPGEMRNQLEENKGNEMLERLKNATDMHVKGRQLL